MNINFSLNVMLAVFLIATQCFADGVAYIANENENRCAKFNVNPLMPEAYTSHTENINDVLKEKTNVDAKRHATDNEKETILKAIMASVVIHGFDSTYRLPAHKIKVGDGLYQHFEILRLTEELTGGLLAQFNDGSMNIHALTGYENLYGFSGKDVNTFKAWFEDVLEKHRPSLWAQKVNSVSADLKLYQSKKVNGMNEMVEFGNIEKRSITGQSVVFVSTYNLNRHQIINNGLFVHLPAKEGRERYIVIENPFFDDKIAETDSSRSPYTIRAHALINADSQPRNVSANTRISNGVNGGAIIEIDNTRGYSVHSHDGTFSPNNMWLENLPKRPLEKDEVFSFVSHVDGDGKLIDTLHIVAYDANSVVNLARNSLNFGDFLQQLSRAHEIFGVDTQSHLAKLMAFIIGTI